MIFFCKLIVILWQIKFGFIIFFYHKKYISMNSEHDLHLKKTAHEKSGIHHLIPRMGVFCHDAEE